MRSLRDKADSTVQNWLLQPAKQRKCRTIIVLAAAIFALSVVWISFRFMVVYNDGSMISPSHQTPTIILDPGKSLIPEKIWQIMFKDDDCDPEDLRETKTWLARNMNYD